jgi:hypothetical protein
MWDRGDFVDRVDACQYIGSSFALEPQMGRMLTRDAQRQPPLAVAEYVQLVAIEVPEVGGVEAIATDCAQAGSPISGQDRAVFLTRLHHSSPQALQDRDGGPFPCSSSMMMQPPSLAFPIADASMVLLVG